MRQRTIYCCEVCGEEFDIEEKAIACEANHYNLTLQEYFYWQELNKSASRISKMLSYGRNADLIEKLDRAIKNLVDFEKGHDLTECKKPMNFYY